MFAWLANAWRVPELRRRLLFTAGVLAVYRLGSWIPAPGVDQTALKQFFGTGGGIRRSLPAPEPLLGLGAVSLFALRARDHAVRHGVDHLPGSRGGHSVARAPAEGRRGRLRQDHAVHPVPHGRAGGGSVDRLRVSLQAVRRADERQRRTDDHHRHHAHGRHDAADVDGRADHEARHRQRDLAPDLRLDPRLRTRRDQRLDQRQHDGAALLPARRARDRRRSRVRDGRAAADPDPVRAAPARQPADRRRLDLHAAQRRDGRRHPDHLRGRDSRRPADDRNLQARVEQSGSRSTSARPAGSTCWSRRP